MYCAQENEEWENSASHGAITKKLLQLQLQHPRARTPRTCTRSARTCTSQTCIHSTRTFPSSCHCSEIRCNGFLSSQLFEWSAVRYCYCCFSVLKLRGVFFANQRPDDIWEDVLPWVRWGYKGICDQFLHDTFEPWCEEFWSLAILGRSRTVGSFVSTAECLQVKHCAWLSPLSYCLMDIRQSHLMMMANYDDNISNYLAFELIVCPLVHFMSVTI